MVSNYHMDFKLFFLTIPFIILESIGTCKVHCTEGQHKAKMEASYVERFILLL